MKTIGLIGGVSWVSSAEYYKRLNEAVYRKLGGLASSKIVLYNFDFAEIYPYQSSNDLQGEARLLIRAARSLEKAGADCILICSNTTSKTSQSIQNNIDIPLINLIQVTAEKARDEKLKNIGLLGTKYVMYGDFYKNCFKKYGITLIPPEKNIGLKIHNIIYDELVKNIFKKSSKNFFKKTVESLSNMGAEAVILGCTEIPLIINSKDTNVKLFDTVQIHIDKALEFAFR